MRVDDRNMENQTQGNVLSEEGATYTLETRRKRTLNLRTQQSEELLKPKTMPTSKKGGSHHPVEKYQFAQVCGLGPGREIGGRGVFSNLIKHQKYHNNTHHKLLRIIKYFKVSKEKKAVCLEQR